MMTQPNHYFIGIPLPAALAGDLYSRQAELKKTLPYKQWTDEADYHITLKFFGAVRDDQLEAVRNSLHKTVQVSPFTCRMTGLGVFGKPDSPRVLWAGVDRPEGLFALQKQIESATAALGFPVENRPYRPHITLGKKWAGPAYGSQLQELLADSEPEAWSFEVAHFNLFQIRPREKPRYQAVETFALKGETAHGTAD